jgi:hypothetical protein
MTFPERSPTFHHPRYEVAPFGSVSAGFPDFHIDVLRVHHADEAVVAEVVMTGTQSGPLCRAPTYRTANRGAVGWDF